VQHRPLLLSSLPIHISWGTSWSFRSHYTLGERPAWTSVAMVQFAAIWTMVIKNLRTVRFHFSRRSFLSRVFLLVQSSDAAILARGNCFLVLSFHLFLFVLFQFALLPG
jgi:hypothetical protein